MDGLELFIQKRGRGLGLDPIPVSRRARRASQSFELRRTGAGVMKLLCRGPQGQISTPSTFPCVAFCGMTDCARSSRTGGVKKVSKGVHFRGGFLDPTFRYVVLSTDLL